MKKSRSIRPVSPFLIVFIMLISASCFSQKGESESGYYLNPGITYTPNAYRWTGKAPDFHTGVFANYHFTNEFRIEGGGGYKLLNINTFFHELCPPPALYPNANFYCAGHRNEKYHFLELPMQLSINLHPKESARVRPYLVGGLALGFMMNIRQARKHYGHESITAGAIFYSAGLDVKIRLNNNRSLTIGAHYDYSKKYYRLYKGIHNPKLVIKISRMPKPSTSNGSL